MREVLELVWKLKDHKQLRLYLLFLILCSVGSSFINSVSGLYLLDNGFPTSTFAAIELFHFPVEILFGMWSGKLGK